MSVLDEYVGIWWIPNIKNDSISGRLYKDKNGEFKLELFGILGDLKDKENLKTVPIINGFSSNGKKITLLHSVPNLINMSFPGLTTETYLPQYIIIGENFDNDNNLRFNSIITRYTDLDKWLCLFPLKINYGEKELNIKYEFPEKFEYNLDDFNIQIFFETNQSRNQFNKYSISQNAYICFNNLKNKSLSEIVDIIYDFSSFLTLCIGAKIYPFDIKAKTIEGKDVEILWNNMIIEESSNKHIFEMLIPYQFISKDIGNILKNWFNKKEILEPVIDHVVDAFVEDVFHIPMSFIKIVQALEVYSRRMRKNYNEDPEEYKFKMEYILNRIDREDYRHWLKDKLKYSYEPNLNKRVKNIFKEISFLHKMSNKKIKDLSYKIVKTRNYFIHYDENIKNEIMNSEQIFYITKFMLITLRILILLDLGIEQEHVIQKINDTNDLWIISKMKEVFGY